MSANQSEDSVHRRMPRNCATQGELVFGQAVFLPSPPPPPLACFVNPQPGPDLAVRIQDDDRIMNSGFFDHPIPCVQANSASVIWNSSKFFPRNFIWTSDKWKAESTSPVSGQLAPSTILPRQLAPDLQTTSPSFFYPLPCQTSRQIYETWSQTNYFSFFYPLPNKLFFVLLSTTESEDRARVVWGELSRGRVVWHSPYY